MPAGSVRGTRVLQKWHAEFPRKQGPGVQTRKPPPAPPMPCPWEVVRVGAPTNPRLGVCGGSVPPAWKVHRVEWCPRRPVTCSPGSLCVPSPFGQLL